MKINLTKKSEKKLLDEFNNCIGFRQMEEEEGELFAALMRYATGASKHIIMDSVIEIEFFSVYDTLKEMLDTVLEHGVDARIYAFDNISDAYRDFILLVNDDSDKSGGPIDPLIATLKRTKKTPYSIDKKAVMKDIKSRLETLKVKCGEIFNQDISGPQRIAIGGSYNDQDNIISIYEGASLIATDEKYYEGKLTTKEIASVSKEAYTTLVAHSFLHELAHLCERCTPEKVIRDSTVRDRAWRITDAWVQKTSLETGAPPDFLWKMIGSGAAPQDLVAAMQEVGAIGHTIYGHCSRFKLALLYLSSIDTKTMFVRPEFVPQIKKEILDSQLLKIDQAGDFVSGLRSSMDDANIQAYSWEKLIYEQYKDAIKSGGIVFRPKSVVADTDDILATVVRIKPRLYHHNPYQQLEDYAYESGIPEDLFYTVGGNANLLSMLYDGDAFEQIALVLENMELVPSMDIPLKYGDPFLGITIENGIARYVYSDFGKVFTTVTVEEAWWLLTL